MLFNLSRAFLFFSLDNVSCNYLVNRKFSFCFHYAIKWDKKVYLQLIIKKVYKIWHNPLKCCLFFWQQKQTPKKIHEKVNSAFHQVVLTKSIYTEIGYQNRFGVPGSNKFNTEICVISHIALVQWIAGRRLNSQELIGCGSDGSGWN